MNQLAAKLSQPESLLADAASLVTGQPAAQDKLGVAAASNPVSVVMSTSNFTYFTNKTIERGKNI